MELADLLKLQAKRGARIATGVDATTSSFEMVLTECRKQIEAQSARYRDLNSERKKDEIRAIVVTYVMKTKPLVKGYIDGENNPDTNKLVDALINNITNYGKLTYAMESEEIFEIRSNGQEIKVEQNGKVTDLLDIDGNIVRWSSPEEQEVVIKKMLGDVKLTPKDALVNGSTIEGFRIAAVHSSAMSPDPLNPTAEKYHSFVLRKFKKQRMNLSEIVRKGTLSDNMARFLALLPAGDMTFFTVGPTASGKTTTNNAILQSESVKSIRVVLIQNPSEIDLRFKDETGRVYNDVLHLEAKEMENPLPTSPTMENAMDHTLRLSPHLVCFGEIRTNREFKVCMKIMQAGHPINTTFHSADSAGAIRRFLTAYLSESGNEPADLALENVAGLVNIIIVQKIMKDGKRRILEITEVEGIDPTNRNQAKLNKLYEFDITDEPEYNEAGEVIRINGEHKRVGTLSKRGIKIFKEAGVATSRFDFLLKDVSPTEVETYSGTNIDKYGMKITKTSI